MYSLRYPLRFCDAVSNWVVLTNEPPGKIGCYYKFEPIKAIVVKDAYDEADFHYFRSAKDPIPKGTELTIDTWWQNFYGSYFKVNYNNKMYDIKTTTVKLIRA